MTADSALGYDIDTLHCSYGTLPCLQDISLKLEPGFFYGLIGPNGSGKSTLLDALSGFISPSAGSVFFNGSPISAYSRRELSMILASVPQSFSLNFDFTVNDVVMMGRHPHIKRFTQATALDYERVEKALESMAIYDLRQRSVKQLSGGEKQRVMIARALAQDTSFILLDEVTASLDINHGISIMKTMSNLVRTDGRTIIAALHDLNMALAFCDRVMVLNNGRLERYGSADEVISEDMIRDIYQVRSHIFRTDNGKNHVQLEYR